ncbi:MAG: hypothetical protein E7070_05145 [Bacteroidales bacterium]|nr:hypothetical protein [Bacteroidales bacterium]
MRPRLTRSPFTLKLAYNADDVLADTDLPVSPQLYEHYGKALRRSVDVTFTQDNGSGLSDRLRANASWFAAHKSAYVMQALRDVQLDPTIPDDQKPDALRAMLRLFDRWTDAEVNTATARARTAKQFEEFMQPDNARLFPNLRWIASRSADPRASHTKFYDRVWAKTDPFWQTNAPGTEWNCKCDIEETDDPVTDNSGVPHHIPPRGLEGNPAETGQLFSENASYVRGTKGVERDCQKIEQKALIRAHTDRVVGECEIDGTSRPIHTAIWGTKEIANKMFGNPDYWHRNQVYAHLEDYLQEAVYVEGKDVDLGHNTNAKRLKLKSHFSKFHYIRIKAWEQHYCVIVAEHENGTLYVYDIEKRRASQ